MADARPKLSDIDIATASETRVTGTHYLGLTPR
jgi:hypothetical protein